MPDLKRFLSADSLFLSLHAQEEKAFLEEMLEQLKEDPRVSNWEELHDALFSSLAFTILSQGEMSAVLYHGRTSHIRDLLVAMGRSRKGIISEKSATPIHLIFLIIIPHALDQEYLRVMGSIARSCSDTKRIEQLLVAPSKEEIIEILTQSGRE